MDRNRTEISVIYLFWSIQALVEWLKVLTRLNFLYFVIAHLSFFMLEILYNESFNQSKINPWPEFDS